MIFTIYEKASGRIERVVSCPDDLVAHQYDPETHAHIEGSADDSQFYVGGGEFVAMPERPSAHHVFDWDAKEWVDPRPVEFFKNAKRQEIERERVRRTAAPVEYDGKTLDADKTAQSNIANKLLEIDGRLAIGLDMPPELLVWRDYHNQNHTFATMEGYREWLHGLTIAISQRGTEAYAWSWAKKELLDSLTTIEDVQGMDLS